jgi:hypothetical protein
MEKMKLRYMKPSMEMMLIEPVRVLDESLPLFDLPFFEEEITDPSEIE